MLSPAAIAAETQRTKVGHDMSKLSSTDVAVPIFIENLEGLLDLLLRERSTFHKQPVYNSDHKLQSRCLASSEPSL